jgi:coenzyme PQQ precursor peptide PqqA
MSYDPLRMKIRRLASGGKAMKWATPVVREVCIGMEVTSYESAEIDPLN